MSQSLENKQNKIGKFLQTILSGFRLHKQFYEVFSVNIVPLL